MLQNFIDVSTDRHQSSYSNLDDAFMNYNLQNELDIINKKNYYNDSSMVLNNNEKSLNIDEKKNNFDGTDISKLLNQKKLTHRECIQLYYNPNINSDDYDTALKHITKCPLCKDKITNDKKIVANNNNEKKININNNSDKNNYNNEQNNSIDKNKYNEMIIQSTIQKYIENIDEKKELNDKINKIYDLLNQPQKSNYDTSVTKNNYTIELNYITVGITIIILLLLIDIIIRIKY